MNTNINLLKNQTMLNIIEMMRQVEKFYYTAFIWPHNEKPTFEQAKEAVAKVLNVDRNYDNCQVFFAVQKLSNQDYQHQINIISMKI